MIGEGKKKMCVTREAFLLAKEGRYSCSTCGARSDDKSVLCDPAEEFDDSSS